jgi:hypothetical protein
MMLPHGGEGLRMRRMTVLWTFRRPFMGRSVRHQLMRNEWLNLTTIVPATAYHRRSYAERYSRCKMMRRARSSQKRPGLLAELERRYLNGS